MQINNLYTNTPKIIYSAPNFCASNPIKQQDKNSCLLDDGTGSVSRAEIEIQRQKREQKEINNLLNSIENCAEERKISKNYLAEIKEHCKNEDNSYNKDALHLADHFMKSGMSTTKKDNILGTIDFCKDKNGFSKQMGLIIENYIDNRMKPHYSYCSNKFSEHLREYFLSSNPVKNKDGVFDKDCLAYLYKYSKTGALDDITCAAHTLSLIDPLVKNEDENKLVSEFKELLFKNEKFMYGCDELISNILNLVSQCDSPEASAVPRVLKRVIKDDNWTPIMIDALCDNCSERDENEELTVHVQLYQYYDMFLKNKKIPAGLINNFVKFSETFTPETIKEWYLSEEGQQAIKAVESVKQHMLENPSLYLNELTEGFTGSDKFNEIMINDFFSEGYNYQSLVHFVGMFDKKTLDVLMRKRLDNVQEYIDMYSNMKDDDREFVITLADCKNIDGKEFTPQEKIHFIDLVNTYKQNRIPRKYLADFMEADENENIRFDLNNANGYLLETVLKKCGLSDEDIYTIPQDKIDELDIKKIHLFIESLKEDKSGAGKDLLKVMMTDDFDKYIQDKNNIYGFSNSQTAQEYQNLGLDYNKWINTNKELEVNLKSGHVNGQSLDNISEQLIEDIESIRKSPMGNFFDKQFKKYVHNGEFIIPKEILTSEKLLGDFTNEILERLMPAKERAERNLNSENLAEVARNTLTYINHIEQRAKDIDTLHKIPTDQKLDVTVKMWDRNPIKDIYQGNYSTCCLAMGNNTNGEALFHYLLNTSFNMIEIVDNKSKNVIGNALCYFVKDENNKPAFIIDNIEINNKNKLSDESSIMLREKIQEYAQNIARDISDKEIPVYLGTNYNDVSTDDLNTISKEMKFVGEITHNNTYLDLYNGWSKKDKLDKIVTVFEL